MEERQGSHRSDSVTAASTDSVHEHRPTRAIAIVGLVAWVGLSFAASASGAFFTPGEWYAGLRKPIFNPPSWVFAPVWSALYLLMGISAWLVWHKFGFRRSGASLPLYLVQLTLNAAWTPVFFGLHAPGPALVIIVLMWLAILATLIAFWQRVRVAGTMLVPYLAWVSFATVLNASLWWLNR